MLCLIGGKRAEHSGTWDNHVLNNDVGHLVKDLLFEIIAGGYLKISESASFQSNLKNDRINLALIGDSNLGLKQK